MDKTDFHPDTRYTITWRDAAGNVRPVTIYVYRVYDASVMAHYSMSPARGK
jgi:hypothetical protein